MTVFITGGCGFIGCNTAEYFLNLGHKVVVFDNLFRAGAVKNLDWLRKNHSDEFIECSARDLNAEHESARLIFFRGDVRNFEDINSAIHLYLANPSDQSLIIHLAAQVAVTSSIQNPREDFDINALGTLNLLEAARLLEYNPTVIFTSTNKVYGSMEPVAVIETPTRYEYRDFPNGISESQPLDFQSPYGCSKGASDQYVRDYARIYGLHTVVFRMSCIYGTRQFGDEDQGWVAHFVISSVLGKPITIYGNGKQVRDILWVGDLVRAFELAAKSIDVTAGQVYNIGGGADNTISIWVEFREILSELLDREIQASYSDWRPGDQLIYVSNITKARCDFGWFPLVRKEKGIEKLYHWVIDNILLFAN